MIAYSRSMEFSWDLGDFLAEHRCQAWLHSIKVYT